MSNQSLAATAAPVDEPKRLAFFERYLTVWVIVCMVAGVAFGKLLPGLTAALSKVEFGQGSQVNVPIGVLL
jgi:arsenite transporter